MSEINALEELRMLSTARMDGWLRIDTQKIADNIEAEIAKKFVALPVDEEGDVLRIGDELKCQGKSILLNSLSWDGRKWYATETIVSSGWYPVHLCRHVKPRTIEDVLRDVWKEAIDYAKSDMWRNPDEAFAERADEIRELMGVDE